MSPPTGDQGDVDTASMETVMKEREREIAMRIQGPILREPQSGKPYQFSRHSTGRGRLARLQRSLNRSLAILETEGPSLSGVSLTALDAALLGFLAEVQLQHAGSGGSSSGRRSGAGPRRSTTPRSTKTQTPAESEARTKARAEFKRLRPQEE